MTAPDYTPVEPPEERLRVRATASAAFAGATGRIVAVHKRLPIFEIELDQQPVNAVGRRFLFGRDQFEVIG